MDPELQQAFAQLEARLTARIDGAEARMEARMEERIARMEVRIEAMETKLLTAFHNWASPTEARQRTHAAALRAIDLEIESHSDRVGKLEGKQPQ